MVSKTTIGLSVMLWVLPRPGIKGGQQDKIRCCGPHPLERGLCVYSQAIADLNLGGFRLRRTASLCPFLGNTERFHPIVEGMIAPGVWLLAPPRPPPPLIRVP